MKISLCLPVYQRPEMLCECLASILEQTYEDYEVVMKDGALGTPAICDHYIGDYTWKFGSRLRYILSKDEGIFPALNEALSHATGDILHFICSDDTLGQSDTLETVARFFEGLALSQPYWAYGITGGMDESGLMSDHRDGRKMTWEEFIQGRGGVGQPTAFWSRGMYEVLGGFNTKYKYAADFDYWCRCWQQAKPMFIDKVLGIGRRWAGASSTMHADEADREAADIQGRYK